VDAVHPGDALAKRHRQPAEGVQVHRPALRERGQRLRAHAAFANNAADAVGLDGFGLEGLLAHGGFGAGGDDCPAALG
jgi:hypothetical protein